MTDNVPITVGDGGKVVAAKDIGGFHFQKMLIADPTTGSLLDPTASSTVKGAAANDAVLTEAPVPIGGLAKSANPTKVGDGDVVYTRHDLTGRVVIVPHQQRDLHSDANITITSSTTATDLLAAGAAGVYRDLISVTLTNTSGTATEVQILNSDGTTVRWAGYVPAGQMTGISFPLPLKGSATATKWQAKTGTSVASVKITVQYVENV